MIKFTTFAGEAPKIDEQRLGNEQAALAIDIDYSSDTLAPKPTDLTNVYVEPTNTESIYLYSPGVMLSWENEVDVVKSQIAQDPWGRIYFTGDNEPKVMSNDSLPVSYSLGVISPENAVVINSIVENLPEDVEAPDEEDLTDDNTRFYIETFVTRFGEEGSNSPVSLESNLDHIYHDVSLTLNTIISNTYNITKRRIYRSATTDAVSGYFLVAELPLATTSYVDTKLDSELGPELSTSTYYAPPANMHSLVAHPSGFVVGIAGNEVIMSESYLPYAFPLDNRHSMEYDGVALATTSDMTIVATKGNPYAIIGTRPDATDAIKLNLNEACIAKKSMVDMGEFVLYASRNGLVAVNANSAQLITKTIIDKESWAQFSPETIRAFLFENRYVAFTDNGGFVFDPATSIFSRLTKSFDCGYHDIEQGELYVCKDGVVDKFNLGASSSTLTWKSKLFDIPDNALFSVCRIESDDITKVGLTVWLDGEVYYSKAIGEITNERFRLPMLRGKKIQFEITSQVKVRAISFGQSMSELV